MPKKTRREKEEIVEKLKEKVSRQKGAVLTRMSGLSVAEATDLRRKIREAGGEFKVTKISLLKLASIDSPLEPLVGDITGTTALVLAYDDPVTVAKAFKGFIDKVPKVEPLSGLLGDQLITAKDILAIADLPAKDVLIAKLVGTIAAPLSGLAHVLSAIPLQLLYALVAIKNLKDNQ
ncbi:MAG: 50S ribosomal protein L10 [Deltaproteobacteria bacterium]|nr:50S ribosomal protein L10 [Deltaproteobacteria bacterium]